MTDKLDKNGWPIFHVGDHVRYLDDPKQRGVVVKVFNATMRVRFEDGSESNSSKILWRSATPPRITGEAR